MSVCGYHLKRGKRCRPHDRLTCFSSSYGTNPAHAGLSPQSTNSALWAFQNRWDVSHPGGYRCAFAQRFGSSMFVCQFCGKTVPPRTPAVRIVVSRRPKQYPLRRNANVFWRLAPDGRMKEYATDDPGGTGWEIAADWLACPACAAEPLSG